MLHYFRLLFIYSTLSLIGYIQGRRHRVEEGARLLRFEILEGTSPRKGDFQIKLSE